MSRKNCAGTCAIPVAKTRAGAGPSSRCGEFRLGEDLPGQGEGLPGSSEAVPDRADFTRMVSYPPKPAE
ncbi:MAG: hypothetical protein JWP04_2623 [Belnapia sp.]|nr:hypothetical protein [Belnapia sp.]